MAVVITNKTHLHVTDRQAQVCSDISETAVEMRQDEKICCIFKILKKDHSERHIAIKFPQNSPLISNTLVARLLSLSEAVLDVLFSGFICAGMAALMS